jgi:2-keto-3-deoxy-L-rhamnonate aldolase RhmA
MMDGLMTSFAKNRLAHLLQERRALLGVTHCYAAEGILETIATGWDFVWIDGQHGQFNFESALRAVRIASGMGLETVLRVPTHDPGLLGLYADTGASALMIPLVDSPQMAAEVVRALRFPPHGNRSFGGRRVIDAHGRDYCRTREPLVVAQIESADGVKNDDMKLHLAFPWTHRCVKARHCRRHSARRVRQRGPRANGPAAWPPIPAISRALWTKAINWLP